jgi:hypothetical protein
MHDVMLLLAQTTSNGAAPSAAATNPSLVPAWLHLPTHWPGQIDLLNFCQTMSPALATLLVIGGLVYLVFGYHLYKPLVTFNAAMVGAYLGAIAGSRAGSAAAGACVGGFLTAAVAFPLLKYAVAFMGGVYGALLGASIWRAAGLDPALAWAGALSGLIFFGMIAFVVFRGSVIMYMSLQGSVMLIFGILGLVYKYQDIAPQVTEKMTLKPFLLPLSILIPALLGLIYQQTQYPSPEPAKKK